MDRQVYEHISALRGDPIVAWQRCVVSGDEFGVFGSDVALLEKLAPKVGGESFALPMMERCPRELWRELLLWSNERHLYKHVCAASGKQTIARFHPGAPQTVYSNQAWSSDAWDAREYGLAYDSSKSVFAHIAHLLEVVPYQNLIGSLSNMQHNAVYTNYTADIHNCYLVFNSDFITDSCYSLQSRRSAFLFGCIDCQECEWCFGVVSSERCKQSCWLERCRGCSFCYHCRDCFGCDHCIGCVGLVNQSYQLYNEAVSQEEYERVRAALLSGALVMEDDERYQALVASFPLCGQYEANCEQCMGNNLAGCRSCQVSFDCFNCEDLRYCTELNHASDCLGMVGYGSHSNLLYRGTGVGRYSHGVYCSGTIGRGEQLLYCFEVKKSRYCFGCVNMRDREYCIFNKQYSKADYEALVPRLIRAMGEEWGRFVPSQYSPFPYNDTPAMDRMPPGEVLSFGGERKVVSEQGVGVMKLLEQGKAIVRAELLLPGGGVIPTSWRVDEQDVVVGNHVVVDPRDLPQDISAVEEGVVNQVLACVETERPYRIVKPELEFHRKMGLALPCCHPEVRMQRLVQRLAPWDLHMRGNGLVSIYPEGDGRKVLGKSEWEGMVFG